MERILKIKLLSFALLSAISFVYLILPENAGISIPIFFMLQFVCFYYLIPKKKSLWLFIPILILSLNSFFSGNTMWRIPNFLTVMVLYSIIVLTAIDSFPIKENSLRFFHNIINCIFIPIQYFLLPFKWIGEESKDKTKIIKRILIGLLISLPCLIFLIIMLSSADTVFSMGVSDFFKHFFDLIDINFAFKTIYGCLIGLYLFGLIFIIYAPNKFEKSYPVRRINGDLVILNAIHISILCVYTLFVVIQFKYLFAGEQLPYGLTFTQYARKGFFELLFLSGLNILFILITVHLTREKSGVWLKINKFFCCYLCSVTIIMLASSFYRMWLYSSDAGLTRLRFLVFGFLIFEAIGLLITYFYIINPKFNMVALYLAIALIYYLILNIVPIDDIIAKNQISRYMGNQKYGLDYIMTLSTDAAPQIERLLSDEDNQIKEMSLRYFENIDAYYGDYVPRWQRFNLSIEHAKQIYAGIEK